MKSGSEKYLLALIDPFAKDAVGCRLPSLDPVATFTHCQFESFTLNTTGYNNTGKCMLVYNPTAIRPHPVVVFNDPTGQFPPLSTDAPLVKDV